jgi:hypothetical protein
VPPPPVPVRRTSTGKGVNKGLGVKRKSESQGGVGEGKRRRSSLTESSKGEISTQPTLSTMRGASPIISPSSIVTEGALLKESLAAKNGKVTGTLAGFDDYSDSEED